ncbi:hypothetical protein BPAE_0071g00480 [Botrytis paeoniae]|uniref:Heterokaryon incompatibility domain-containing protein n=1 Tax=Botrytis paeoniae TaxID=278948 RepID=A0A4Z1FMM7_9HELO|nr:hypothetical protein BPAE_0071g00480 [Botrytis paeoniae]
MDSYQYQPINLGRPSIRLLQLYKGHWSDKIQGHFISAWFDDPDSFMPYSALSYAWGYIDKVEEVIIDGARIKVTFNSHMALQHLRSEEEDQIFWIDALCINQENVHEKIHQIRQMGDIYKKAEKVVVWLGRGTEETDLVMDAMKRLRKASLGWHSAEWKDKANDWVDENNEHLPNLRDQMRLILERPWFRRIWILQEVANARRATTVHCGNRSISATIFSQFPALIALNPAVHCQSVLDIMPGISRKESWWTQGQKLHTLLVRFRESEATDDRDKIYALLGISSDAHRSNILDPKCDKSSQQVIREAVSFILAENVEDLEGAMLMDAFENAEAKFLKFLIETDVFQISSRGFHDRTSVHWAIQREQQIIVQMLLDKSLCSFEKRDSNGQTPLLSAIQTGNAGIVELLLAKGAEIEGNHLSFRTPLMLAFDKEKLNIVDILVKKGAELRAKDMASYHESLHDSLMLAIEIATIYNNMMAIEILLEKYTEPHNRDIYYQTALITAIGYNKMEAVELSLGKGADFEGKDKDGQTALLLAAKKADHDVFELLLQRGMNIEAKDNFGRTALSVAVLSGNLLLEMGAKLETKDHMGRTPLQNAILSDWLASSHWHQQEIVMLLLEKGAELETRDQEGKTPLHNAIISHWSTTGSYSRHGIVMRLLEKGAELETRDHMGNTPMQNLKVSYLGSEISRKELLALLLEWGAINRMRAGEKLKSRLLAKLLPE